MRRFDDMRSGIEVLSNGTNTVVFDSDDAPSVMVVIPKMTSSELWGGAATTHPAFIVGSTEHEKVGFSKFINTVVNSKAYSLPMKDPWCNVTWTQANTYCRNKGENWCLVPDTLWAAVAHYSRKNKTLPHGNSNFGADIAYPNEKGEISYTYTEGTTIKNGRTYTGSGPSTWGHDHTPFGIQDMCGNVWKWTCGTRLVNGELQFIPNANCSQLSCSVLDTSTDYSVNPWRAILPNGTFVNPGTAGTIKMDSIGGKWVFTTANITGKTSVRYDFKASIAGTVDDKTVTIPNYLKDIGLFPTGDLTDYGSMGFWANNNIAETVSCRGGGWDNGAYCGSFCTGLGSTRARADRGIGFVSAYYGAL